MKRIAIQIFCWCLVGAVMFPGCNQTKEQAKNDDFEPIQPALTINLDSPADDPTMKNVGSADPEGERIRTSSMAILAAGGFHAAESLPTLNHRAGVPAKLRSPRDIALRVMALKALFIWASVPESAVASDRIVGYVDRNGLRKHLTSTELKIISLPREQAMTQHGDTIGWRLENIWALCWLLGYNTPPDPMSGQLPDKITESIILEFLQNLDSSVDDLISRSEPRTLSEVLELEDTFYCSHNAVRSAQTGSTESVPADFHPVFDGGAIHERRHALTWAISDGVSWDDTDLST